MTKAISLVVDTNLFFECRVLEEIPWHELGYDEIELLITQPVQNEIDKHKKNPSGRTYKRALKYSSLFRDMAINKEKKVIKSSAPYVTLDFARGINPDKSYKESLDYSKNDDAIVGCLSELAKNNTVRQHALLTHDTGPMLTAQNLGLNDIPIPDLWLLPAQQDGHTKELNKLKNEIKRLQLQEPKIEVDFYDAAQQKIERLNCERIIYTELEEEKIDGLLEKIREKYPEEQDFGSPETTPKPLSQRLLVGVSQWEFTAATPSAIEKYCEAYEQWLDKCRKVLSTLHETLNQQETPCFLLTASNTGTRPAASALIEFNMEGNLQFFKEPDESEEDKPECRRPMTCSSSVFPDAPMAPKGSWKAHTLSRSVRDIARIMNRFGDNYGLMRATTPNSIISLHRDFAPPRRDPNGFYWKGDRPDLPLTRTSLTCEQWRHSSDDQGFKFCLDSSEEEQEISGLFSCKIHAENLADPTEARLPIKITTVIISCEDKAEQLVATFTSL